MQDVYDLEEKGFHNNLANVIGLQQFHMLLSIRWAHFFIGFLSIRVVVLIAFILRIINNVESVIWVESHWRDIQILKDIISAILEDENLIVLPNKRVTFLLLILLNCVCVEVANSIPIDLHFLKTILTFKLVHQQWSYTWINEECMILLENLTNIEGKLLSLSMNSFFCESLSMLKTLE